MKVLGTANLVLAGFFLTGCGGGMSVQGKITVNGEPVEQAEILFVPVNSKDEARIGSTVSNGTFEIRDTPQLKPGDYQVQVRAYRGTGKKIWDGMGDGKNKTMVEETAQFIPEKYNDVSELKTTLNSGANSFNADLQFADKPPTGK